MLEFFYPIPQRKVEKILKGNLDLISSVKIQIMGGKVCFRHKAGWQNIAGHCQQTFCIQKLADNIQQCFAFTHYP